LMTIGGEALTTDDCVPAPPTDSSGQSDATTLDTMDIRDVKHFRSILLLYTIILELFNHLMVWCLIKGRGTQRSENA
jgi:hypothetical protein